MANLDTYLIALYSIIQTICVHTVENNFIRGAVITAPALKHLVDIRIYFQSNHIYFLLGYVAMQFDCF